MATGVERFYEDAAYTAALMEYLIEHKSDNETDAELADILADKPFMFSIVIGVMQNYKKDKV